MSVSGGVTPIDGMMATLDCSVVTDGNPVSYTYTWSKAGTVVQAASAMSTYTFAASTADDQMSFECSVSNTIGADPSGSLVIDVNSELFVNIGHFSFCFSSFEKYALTFSLDLILL